MAFAGDACGPLLSCVCGDSRCCRRRHAAEQYEGLIFYTFINTCTPPITHSNTHADSYSAACAVIVASPPCYRTVRGLYLSQQHTFVHTQTYSHMVTAPAAERALPHTHTQAYMHISPRHYTHTFTFMFIDVIKVTDALCLLLNIK